MPAQKTVEVDREKIIQIIQTTLEEPAGSEIYIPCSSKKEQKDTHTCIIRELKVLSEICPQDAASLFHRAVFKDSHFWVVLTRIEPALNAIFIKRDGVITKKELN